MNWLLIDIGNSRLKWADWRGAQLTAGGAVEYQGRPLPQLWEQCWRGRGEPQRVVAISVAGDQVNRSLSQWCSRTWGVVVEFPDSQPRACGVINGYREPARLGVDRWAALVAVHSLFGRQAVCVADCGTALTVDMLDPCGRHLGGIVLPGLTAMRSSLQRSTAGIGPLQGRSAAENEEPGRDTESAVMLGCFYAASGAMERAAGRLRRIAEATASDVRCVITGGDARQLLPHLRGQWHYRPQLVLEGARVLAEDINPAT